MCFVAYSTRLLTHSHVYCVDLLLTHSGDILFHINQARTYVKFETYIEGARTFLDVLGIKNILILTDSMAALEEATMCKEKFPALCGDLTFQWVDKKRWIGGEGGWENPFPSGSSKVPHITHSLTHSLTYSITVEG